MDLKYWMILIQFAYITWMDEMVLDGRDPALYFEVDLTKNIGVYIGNTLDVNILDEPMYIINLINICNADNKQKTRKFDGIGQKLEKFEIVSV